MSIRTFLVESDRIREHRPVTVFLPDEVTSLASIPVVYCTDGEAVGAFAAELAPRMHEGCIPACILVGVHSAPEVRSEEYLHGVSAEDYEAHEDFFVRRVVSWSIRELGLSLEPRRTAIFGFSNGGAFAFSAGIRYPEQFGVVIAFSVARSPGIDVPRAPPPAGWPRFYLASGTQGPERMFRKHTLSLVQALRRRGIEPVYSERDLGHCFDLWCAELGSALSWAFGSE